MRTRTVVHSIANIAALTAAVAALSVSACTHDAPTGGYAHTASPAELAGYHDWLATQPVNVPTWETHGQAGCTPVDGQAADTVLVVTQGNDVQRMDFDRAWQLSHNSDRADDVWTIGVCR